MPDPFEALRTAPTPIDPDPAFAARLRERVARKLHPDQGEQSITMQSTQTTQATDRVRQGDISYVALWVRDVARADRFLCERLGWRYEPNAWGDNRLVEGQSISLGIAQLDAALDYQRQLGTPVPADATQTIYVVFEVDNLEAAITNVRQAGGFADDPKQAPWGRVAACSDKQGLLFSLHEIASGVVTPRPAPSGSRHGDIAYLVFEMSDSAQARAFYSSALGLQFTQGRSEDGWTIVDSVPMSGLSGGHAQATIVPMFRVDDIQAAIERVRAAGGTATDPLVEPYGTRAECTDDQGTRFLLGQV